MRNWKSEGADHTARQKRADEKIDNQDAVARTLDGHGENEATAQQTLSAMKQNKASLDMNHAIFDYEKDGYAL